MLTIQDFGNEAVYNAVLTEVKENLPLGKKLFKSKFTEKEAATVKKICISETKLENLEFLKLLPNLEEIRLKSVIGLANLSGLRHCYNLEVFEATNSEVKELGDVAYCRNLTYFGYWLDGEYQKYGLNDFTFLQELSELEVVCITNHKLDDVSVFSNLHRVEHLILEGNPIKTIEPLKNMQSLKQLEVEGCGLSELEGIAEFKALETLCVAENLFTEEQKQKYLDTYFGIEIDFEN